MATARGCVHNNVKDAFDCFDDDEADSVLILPWFPCGGTVTLCDDPSDCLEDDKVTIALLKPIPAGSVYCVRTLQQSYEDEYVKVVYDRINGLNGKVSSVEVCEPGVISPDHRDEWVAAATQCDVADAAKVPAAPEPQPSPPSEVPVDTEERVDTGSGSSTPAAAPPASSGAAGAPLAYAVASVSVAVPVLLLML